MSNSQHTEDMKENYHAEFIKHRNTLGILHKTLAFELGISPRALTERITGRAAIKRETILAMRYLVEDKQNALPGIR